MKQSFLLLVLFALVISSCKKDKPKVHNEEEVITTFVYTLTPENGGSALELKIQDLDGDGGNEPVLYLDTLKSNTVYKGEIKLLNELENPAENITEEIEEEDEDHQFFFKTDIAGLTISYDDQDSNKNPVGLSTLLTTGSVGSGKLTITLLHEPNKAGAGVSAGDFTNAGGETDVKVTFDVEIQD